jgi:hypothetical protein
MLREEGIAGYPEVAFDEPHLTRRSETVRYTWGDDQSGQTSDWIYVSMEDVSQVVFGMPSGARYRQSDDFRDAYDSDILWRLLSGEVVIADPDTGEVGRAVAGESFFFEGEMRRFVYSIGAEPARLLEFSVPSAIESVRHARRYTDSGVVRLAQDEFLGRWPHALREQQESSRIHVLRPEHKLWRLSDREIPVGVLVSTPRLTAGEIRLRPGEVTETLSHSGPSTVFVQSGLLSVQLPSLGRWLEGAAWDGAYLPPRTEHRFHNPGSASTTLLFQVVGPYVKSFSTGAPASGDGSPSG